MGGRLPQLEDLPDVSGKKVLLRADFNVPIATASDGAQSITDDYRITSTLPTIEWLREHGAEVTICTHLGRPDGRPDPAYSLDPVRARLEKLAPGVRLLENLRFSPGEEANDAAFVDALVEGQDAYVNDAFAVSHRAHASVVGPPARLPSAAGRLLAREVEVLSGLLDSPERPFVAIVGGAKVGDKLGVLRALAAKVDVLVVGGGMSYTFFKALGHEVGASLLDERYLDSCAALLAGDVEVRLPVDVVALSPGSRIHRGEQAPESERTETFGRDVPGGWEAADIGPETRRQYADVIASARTVLWNGPMGVFEDGRFAAGTRAVAEAVAASEAFSVVGGGDSVAALEKFQITERIGHISTGGGASLEFLERGDLPGLAALRAARRA